MCHDGCVHRILIVEDDSKIREELAKALQASGYAASTLTQFGEDTIGKLEEAIQAGLADLILLDLGLPGIDGHYICRQLRKPGSVGEKTPLIVVTSRDSEIDELLAVNTGADDFVTKPYNIHILLARIGRVLARTRQGGNEQVIRCGKLTVIPDRAEVSCEGRVASLTRNELKILSLLMRNAGSVVSRHRIQVELWQSDEFVDDNTLTVNVSHLRSTLKGIGAGDVIHTKRGLGYMVEVSQ